MENFPAMDQAMEYIVRFGTGDIPYSTELQAFWMAVQGAMAVRNGPNKEGKLHWFHAFALSVLAGFSGGWFGFLWMGKYLRWETVTLFVAAKDLTHHLCHFSQAHIDAS